MKTMLLTQREIARILTPALANETVERVFKACGQGQTQMPPKSYLFFPKGDLRSMPAYISGEGFDIAGVKCVNVHPQNHGSQLPTVMAVIILNDPETGFPLAIMDGTYLTGLRTGAAGAVAAKYLAREDAEVAGFVGTGTQARTQLACLLAVRKIRKIKIWKYAGDKRSAEEFSRWAETEYSLKTLMSSSIERITENTDIVITTTPSRSPLVHHVSPGTHITAIGADAPGKQEIDSALVKQAKVVVDDWEQASHSGEINVPVSRKEMTQRDVYASLGEIVAGKKKGRNLGTEITLFDATGLAIEDISCAEIVYRTFRNKRGSKGVELF